MGPLYKFGWFNEAYGMQLAVLTGFFFGFVLERAGFGTPKKLVAIFYLKDFAVLKVMLTAIVVCMLGLLYFSVFGWMDLDRVYLLPTYIWPQIIGGLLLGVGFVMGGYCPTTSVVATVSGKLDGLVFIVGMTLGSILFAELFPLLQNLYIAGDLGSIRLSGLLGIQSGLVALLVCIFAVAAFWVAQRVEDLFGDPEVLPAFSRRFRLGGAAILLALGLILAIVNPDEVAVQRQAVESETAPPVTEEKKAAESEEESGEVEFTIVDDEGC